MNAQTIHIIDQGLWDYPSCLKSMQQFTHSRDEDTIDQLWLTQHPSVYTQGIAGKPEHIIRTSGIPIIQSDRGGQITYHGPGQAVFYTLLDLKRLGMSIKDIVCGLEQITIDLLKDTFNLIAIRRKNAPGVYIKDNKIASLGLRLRKQRCYHGLALNVNMDLSPFEHINPCGIQQLFMTQIAEYHPKCCQKSINEKFISHFCQYFGYNNRTLSDRRK
jgi:lipoyl(octanoyl) transferase